MTDFSFTPQFFAGLFAVTAGLAAAAGCYGLVQLAAAGQHEARLRQRLRREFGKDVTTAGLAEKFSGLVGDLGRRLSHLFFKGGDDDAKSEQRRLDMRRKLIQAGIYQADAARLLMSARVGLGLGGAGVGFLAGSALGYDPMLTLAMGGGVGYMAPMFWLKKKIKANQKSLSEGLPDGLDLMVVCVEAGLTIDAAMQRVGEELALAHPVISREFSICHMETRVGVHRQQALRNLGDRTNFVPLQSLAAMLCQAERFGTSIAKALRIQADGLRQKRQSMAEEAAAKASVKLTFPLVLFIFPASFIVMAGPVVLKMKESGFFGG